MAGRQQTWDKQLEALASERALQCKFREYTEQNVWDSTETEVTGENLFVVWNTQLVNFSPKKAVSKKTYKFWYDLRNGID